MIDVADFGAMITSLRAVADLAKLVVDAHDAGVRREKSIELQRQIVTALESTLAAQMAQSTLLKQVGELEKKVTDLEAWDAEKQKYKLAKASPHADVFAYALKEDSGSSEPRHYICANCYEDRFKSVLQIETRIPLAEVLVCARCRTDIYLSGNPLPAHAAAKPPSRRTR
jgi:superfamily II helicase